MRGHVAKVEDMSVPVNDCGVDNVHPHVNRLVAFWRSIGGEDWVEQSDHDDLKAMLVDLSPVVRMYRAIEQRLAKLAAVDGDAAEAVERSNY